MFDRVRKNAISLSTNIHSMCYEQIDLWYRTLSSLHQNVDQTFFYCLCEYSFLSKSFKHRPFSFIFCIFIDTECLKIVLTNTWITRIFQSLSCQWKGKQISRYVLMIIIWNRMRLTDLNDLQMCCRGRNSKQLFLIHVIAAPLGLNFRHIHKELQWNLNYDYFILE